MTLPVIIPARLASTRFPRKPLASILGTPMILRVCQNASKVVGKSNVWVATDSKEIELTVMTAGYRVVLTDQSCKTGSDRVAEAMRQLGVKRAISIQGDEPLLGQDDIARFIMNFESGEFKVMNAMAPILDEKSWRSYSVPKMVVTEGGSLIYASRSPVPGSKSGGFPGHVNQQVCIYGFDIDAMEIFGVNGQKTIIEEIEDIEILRFITHEQRVHVIELPSPTIGVDHPDDIARVEQEILRQESLI